MLTAVQFATTPGSCWVEHLVKTGFHFPARHAHAQRYRACTAGTSRSLAWQKTGSQNRPVELLAIGHQLGGNSSLTAQESSGQVDAFSAQLCRGRRGGLGSSDRRRGKLYAVSDSASVPSGGDTDAGRADAAREQRVKAALKELSGSLAGLDPDLFKSLPADLLVDLRDAGFALSNGPVARECGDEVGGVLLKLGAALESADTRSATQSLAALPPLAQALPPVSPQRAALGRRLTAASRSLSSMGAFQDGAFQKVAKAWRAAGDAISEGCSGDGTTPPVEQSQRILKFGSLDVEVTAGRAFAGSGFAFGFGVLCLQLQAQLVSLPDAGGALPASLRGALQASVTGSTFVSLVACVGLIALGVQLKSQEKS